LNERDQDVRVVQVNPICSAPSRYSWMQVIVWRCVWYTTCLQIYPSCLSGQFCTFLWSTFIPR